MCLEEWRWTLIDKKEKAYKNDFIGPLILIYIFLQKCAFDSSIADQQHNNINCFVVRNSSPADRCAVILFKDTSSTSSFVFDQVSIDFLDTFIMAHGHVKIEDGQEKNKIRQSQDDLIGPQPACFINRLALFFNLISLLTTVLCHLLR